MPRHTRIAELMTKQLVTFAPLTPITEASRTMLQRHISGAPVVERSRIVGMLSERDCIKPLVEGSYLDLPELLVSDLMSRVVHTVHIGESVAAVAERFFTLPFRRFPVIDDHGTLRGIISRRDILKYLQRLSSGAAREQARRERTPAHGSRCGPLVNEAQGLREIFGPALLMSSRSSG